MDFQTNWPNSGCLTVKVAQNTVKFYPQSVLQQYSPMPQPVVLASSSVYRQALLDRLQIPYLCRSPNIDESPLPGENPQQLSLRLSREKAYALASTFPQHLIIGSDQVAAIDDKLLGKPETLTVAAQQLRLASGNQVSFYTSVTLLNAETSAVNSHTDITRVYFRKLTDNDIQRYLEAEQPYDCAGSFKVEGLGITLFERIENSDPTALIGLPLIRLAAMLRTMGVSIL